ncbi:hypothetical protein GCM10009092_38710 [Bowmanella denitrificans]|uniref:Uncharacterized protein n=1 Tax=Bowmanella denitrificans TaxID=366582 RepID=A0ABN0XR02_9ALTE
MTPLNEQDLMALSRTGEQIRHAIRQLLQDVPEHARTITGLSEFMDINRSNSQRLLTAAHRVKTGHDVICALPGIEALDEFVAKSKQLGLDKIKLAEAGKAIEQFRLAIHRYARSHADLKRRLSIPQSQGNIGQSLGGSALELRHQHFIACKQLLGVATEQLFSVHILFENPHRQAFLQELALVAKQGILRNRHAQPFIQYYSHSNPPDFEGPQPIQLDSEMQPDQFSVGVIEPFSSDGLMQAYSGYSAAHSALVFNELGEHHPFDATFLFSNPDELANPLHSDSPFSSTSISIKHPTARLQMLVFLHKDIDRKSNVSTGCYAANSKVQEGKLSSDELWSEKLPDSPELRLTSYESVMQQLQHRQQMMLDFLFHHANLVPEQFSCYLLDIQYPIWSSTYRIYFAHR